MMRFYWFFCLSSKPIVRPLIIVTSILYLSGLLAIIFLIVPSSSPENLTVEETPNLSLLVRWSCINLEDRNGVILGYDLIFLDRLTNKNQTLRLIGSDQLQYDKKDLEKYYSYQIMIAGRTSAGVSRVWNSVEISNLRRGIENLLWILQWAMKEGRSLIYTLYFYFFIFSVPPPSPQNISVISLSSTSIKITWSVVMFEHFNDILRSYEIHVKDVLENNTQIFSVHFNSTLFVFEKNGLKKYHTYCITMAVTSTGGTSDYSPWFEVTTLEDGKLFCYCPNICGSLVRKDFPSSLIFIIKYR